MDKAYQTTGNPETEPPHPIAPRDVDVLTTRHVHLDVARARSARTVTGNESVVYGYRGRHALDALLYPLWNTQGEIGGYLARPHNPPVEKKIQPDGTVKTRKKKYLQPAGQTNMLDVHPASQSTLRDVAVPMLMVEGPIKADAVISAIEPDSYSVTSILSCWGWRSGDMPIGDFRDIPWKQKRGDKIVHRRKVVPLLDGDAATKPSVAAARWQLTELLRDRFKADVWWVDVPQVAGDGTGVDDYLAAGGTMEELLASAYRAPKDAPELAYAKPSDKQETELEYWQRRCKDAERRAAEANRRASLLVQIIRNPEAKETEKRIMVSALTLAASEASRGKYEPDGRIKLEPRHVANDHRGQPKRGESLSERNPFDDTKPLTRRARVPNILQAAADAGVVTGFEIRHIPTRNDDGTWTKYPEILIDPPQLNEALEKVAAYIPADAKPRQKYTRQECCPHCGERHEWKVVCTGCGGEADTRRNQPGPTLHVVDDDDTEPMVAQHDDEAELLHSKNVRSSEGGSVPVSGPTSLERTKNERTPIREEIEQRMTPSSSPPAPLFDSGRGTNGDDGTCCLCSNPRMPGSTYFCGEHLQDSKRRASEVAS